MFTFNLVLPYCTYHARPQVLIIYTHTDESWSDELGVGTGGGLLTEKNTRTCV